MNVTIYLDMDGVCCDFLDGALRLLQEYAGIDRDRVMRDWPQGEWALHKHVGITDDTLFELIASKGGGPAFWSGLAEYDHARELYDFLSGHGDVVYLSAPTTHPCSLHGKVEWLQKRRGQGFRDYILTTHKHRLATPRALLIDDHPENCQKFVSHGGFAVQFPSPGFPLRESHETVLDYTKRKVRDALFAMERRDAAPRVYSKGVLL